MLNAEELATLKERIHRSVDAILDEFLARYESISFTPSTRTDHNSFQYTWPDRNTETFSEGVWYNVLSSNTEIAQFLVARTTRNAWGRQRLRYVVFLQGRGKNSTAIYPLAEFVEADTPIEVHSPEDKHFAAKIPDPQQPQKFLKDHDLIPQELSNADIRPVDQLFQNVQGAKSLRRVVILKDNGIYEMLSHAYWAGRMKKRF